MNSIESPVRAKFTVAFDGDNWSAFPDEAKIPENWTVWQTGLSWEEAHDAINT